MVLGRVAWALGDHNEATSAVESGLRSNRESMALLVTLAEFQIGLQQWEKAWDTVSQLSELITSFRRIIVSPEEHWTLNFRYAQAGVLRARWYLHSRNPKRDPSAAARIVDNLIDYPIPLTFTSKVFQDLGVLCTASGKWEESVVVFKNATAVAPKAVSPRIQLITALSRVGQIKEAVAECRQLTEWDLHPHYQSIVWFDYTQLLLELELSKPRSEWLWDEFDKALAQLKRIEGDRPNVVLLELDAQNVRRGAASESAVASELRDFEGEFDDSELFWRGAAGFYLRFGLAEDANRAISKLEQLSGNLGITQQGRQNIVDASGPELINGDSDQDALNRAKQFDSEYRQALQEQRIRDAFRILRDWRHQLPASLQPKAELMKLARRLSRSGKHQDLEEGLRV
ncbi:MAG: hypothetical protein O6942_01545, partial [Bacteroidetes bacterium]|nr:hypothetical protein [Bacteroidota bacterium]